MRLSLPEKETNILKDLIVNLEFADRDAWRDPRFPLQQQPSPQDVAVLADEYRQTYNNEVRNLIGDENIDMFNHYMETLYDRRTSEELTSRFPYEAEPLTPVAKEQFVDVCYEVRKAYEAGIKLNTNNALDDTGRMTFFRDGILAQAKPILTTAQYNSVENWFSEQLKTLDDVKKASPKK